LAKSSWRGDRHGNLISATPARTRTLYIEGEVRRTFAENGAHYAEIAQRAINQDGELSVTASATVRLPSRGAADGEPRSPR
jgi:hypothetical protein